MKKTETAITFKARGGCSPSCVLGEYKYILNETRSRNTGRWVYRLERVKIAGAETKKFSKPADAEAYYNGCIVGQRGDAILFCHSRCFVTKEKVYEITDDNVVRIVNNVEVISEEFSTFKECATFAVKYLEALDIVLMEGGDKK